MWSYQNNPVWTPILNTELNKKLSEAVWYSDYTPTLISKWNKWPFVEMEFLFWPLWHSVGTEWTVKFSQMRSIIQVNTLNRKVGFISSSHLSSDFWKIMVLFHAIGKKKFCSKAKSMNLFLSMKWASIQAPAKMWHVWSGIIFVINQATHSPLSQIPDSSSQIIQAFWIQYLFFPVFPMPSVSHLLQSWVHALRKVLWKEETEVKKQRMNLR